MKQVTYYYLVWISKWEGPTSDFITMLNPEAVLASYIRTLLRQLAFEKGQKEIKNYLSPRG